MKKLYLSINNKLVEIFVDILQKSLKIIGKMVRIRLMRTGKRNRPHYRIVVADARCARDGRCIEILGHYDPIKKIMHIDSAKYEDWLKKGAQPTDSVARLIKRFTNKEVA